MHGRPCKDALSSRAGEEHGITQEDNIMDILLLNITQHKVILDTYMTPIGLNLF